jgi:hypothetical protein
MDSCGSRPENRCGNHGSLEVLIKVDDAGKLTFAGDPLGQM